MAQTLAAVFALNDRYTAAIRTIMKSQDEFEKKQSQIDKATEVFNKRQEQLKNTADKTSASMGGLAGKLAGLVSVSLLLKKAWDGTISAINTAAVQKVQETTFQALVNSEKIGSQLYQYVGAYARVSALSREQTAQVVTAALPITRNINQIEQMIKFVERLQAKDPTKGVEQAIFSIKELMSGDVVSARGVYGITGISGEELRNLKAQGDIEGMFKIIDRGLNSVGATQEVVTKNFNGLITQLGMLKTNFASAIGEQATPMMERLSQTVVGLNENMNAGKYQPFINLLVNGMELIGNGLAFVGENAYWLIPAVGGVVTALIAYNTATAIAAVVTNGLLGNWGGMVLLAGAVAGTVAGMSLAMKDVSNSAKNAQTSAEAIKNSLAEPLGKTKIDAEIVNSDPIKVSGEVDIEQESMKYLLDIAGAKFFAQYSTATLAPQNTFNVTVTKEPDLEVISDYVAESLATATEGAPKGVYKS